MITEINVQSAQDIASLTELQQTVGNKLNFTKIEVLKEIHVILLNSRTMSPLNFFETHVASKQAQLSEIDERTSKFFQCVMKEINVEIDIRFSDLKRGFMMLASVTNEPQFRKKFIEGIAFPHVQKLIRELDDIKPSIIDDINAA